MSSCVALWSTGKWRYVPPCTSPRLMVSSILMLQRKQFPLLIRAETTPISPACRLPPPSVCLCPPLSCATTSMAMGGTDSHSAQDSTKARGERKKLRMWMIAGCIIYSAMGMVSWKARCVCFSRAGVVLMSWLVRKGALYWAHVRTDGAYVRSPRTAKS